MPGLGHVSMTKQPNSTACWLSVANFCGRAVGMQTPPVSTLVTNFQNAAVNAGTPMQGAGKPTDLLTLWNIAHNKLSGAGLTKGAIATHVNTGRPVICGLKFPTISGAAHAVVVVGATNGGATFALKDPGRIDPDRIVIVDGDALLTGFSYGNAFFSEQFAYAYAAWEVG